jgi:phosphoglycerol transferase MdoB-like AlkP superfamily enzyme
MKPKKNKKIIDLESGVFAVVLQIILYHIVFTGIFSSSLFLLGLQKEMSSLLVASFIVGLNLVLLIWGWRRIFLKKSIALAVSAIVFKYAILGVLIYLILTRMQINPLAFIVGLSTMIPTTLAYAYSARRRERLEASA